MTPISSREEMKGFRARYHAELVNDTVPFWIEHAIDSEDGGYLFCLDRKGSVIDTDKSIWTHGRFVWLLSTLYRTVEAKQEWIDTARSGLEFLRAHGFDNDGRMFFLVDKKGAPLRKRRYLFSECFAVLAFAAYGRATGDERSLAAAVELFKLIIRYYTTAGLLPPKVDPATRSARGIGMPMMILAIAQELSDATGDPLAVEWRTRAIEEILSFHVKSDPYRVLETVGPNGEFLDHFEGRCVTPGHIIEAGWFILDESRRRGGDAALTEAGARMVDWAWQLGWDSEYGGLLYYRDIDEKPPAEYWHDMKFWWQHNEAIIAALLAYKLTNEERYLEMHRTVHDWSYRFFPDPEHGEWFGYLHRDGSVSTTLKGGIWKGPYHLPRMLWYCYQLIDEMLET